MAKGKGVLGSIGRQGSFKPLFSGSRKSQDDDDEESPGLEGSPSGHKKWITELSSLANVVVGRCARTLLLSTEDMQQHFETEASDSIKHPSRYARNFLEYCCFKALAVATQLTDHLSDKNFRRLTFDMMLAWEAPAAASKPLLKVDTETSVGPEAFARVAPAIPTIADMITACNLFDVLTASNRELSKP